MISSVRGVVLAASGTTIAVELGGVGLTVTVTPAHALGLRLGAETFIRTVLIVREDDLALFGFETVEQLQLFELLRGVTGVGPKSAMGVLSVMTPEQIAQAVAGEDDGAFRKVSGIGPKTAKLIVVSLAGKVHFAQQQGTAASPAPSSKLLDDVVSALLGLGWNARAASEAAESALARVEVREQQTVQAVLRLALAELGPRNTSSNPPSDADGEGRP